MRSCVKTHQCKCDLDWLIGFGRRLRAEGIDYVLVNETRIWVCKSVACKLVVPFLLTYAFEHIWAFRRS